MRTVHGRAHACNGLKNDRCLCGLRVLIEIALTDHDQHAAVSSQAEARGLSQGISQPRNPGSARWGCPRPTVKSYEVRNGSQVLLDNRKALNTKTLQNFEGGCTCLPTRQHLGRRADVSPQANDLAAGKRSTHARGVLQLDDDNSRRRRHPAVQMSRYRRGEPANSRLHEQMSRARIGTCPNPGIDPDADATAVLWHGEAESCPSCARDAESFEAQNLGFVGIFMVVSGANRSELRAFVRRQFSGNKSAARPIWSREAVRLHGDGNEHRSA
jgi:hypothetical protein